MIRLGTPTWETAKFKGTLYDYNTPIDEFLKNYAAQYDTGEYHVTFFDGTSERRMSELRKEIEVVNKDFRLCPVIPRRISHELAPNEIPYDMQEFVEAVDCLGPHLGVCILRLPEVIAPGQWKNIMLITKHWPKDKRLAIQLTHAEWFKHLNPWKDFVSSIRGTKMSILIEDRMELPFDAESLLSPDHLFVRFFGRMNPDEPRIQNWLRKFHEYHGETYFILNEEEEMCLSMLKRIATSLGNNVRIPQTFRENASQISFQF